MTSRRPPRPALAGALLLSTLAGASAQGARDESDAVGPEDARAVAALVARQLRSEDARVTDLRMGRAGALCGRVEARNRMGAYTGPRGFVADLAEGFVGRLPEAPEMRHPASAADYRAMERARALFAENCGER